MNAANLFTRWNSIGVIYRVGWPFEAVCDAKTNVGEDADLAYVSADPLYQGLGTYSIGRVVRSLVRAAPRKVKRGGTFILSID